MHKNIGFNFFALILVIIFLTLPFFVFGQIQHLLEDQNPKTLVNKIAADNGPYSSETDSDTVMSTVALIINISLGLLSVIFLILTIYSGIRWMTAQGNEEEVTKAKTTLTQAILGLIIVISSWGIWELIARFWLSNL